MSGFKIMALIFLIVFWGFFIAAKIEQKMGRRIDTIIGIA